MSDNHFQKTLIIGLGLIGGSFAKALLDAKICENIIAFDPDIEAIDLAKNDGVIRNGYDNLAIIADEILDCDFIVIATPLLAYEDIFNAIADDVAKDALIIDLGSLKSFIKNVLPKNLTANFIACHPIAGSEKNGFEHADAQLFRDKKFIICKNFDNTQSACDRIANIATAIGAKVEEMKHKKHDEIYALVSHMPQFLSFMMQEFLPTSIRGDFFKTAFRLHDSNPAIWSDIFSLNAANLEKYYLVLFDHLETLIDTPNHLEKLIEEYPQNPSNSDALTQVDRDFLHEHFPEIFAQAILVHCYLQIADIKKYREYAGKGFEDFTSIITILDLDKALLESLLAQHRPKILSIFDQIS